MHTTFHLENSQLANEACTTDDFALQDIEIHVTTCRTRDSDIIQMEKLALDKMKPGLINDPAYYGKYVAVHNGKIVGVHEDLSVLIESTYDEFGYIPILMEKIQRVPAKYYMRSPRIGQS